MNYRPIPCHQDLRLDCTNCVDLLMYERDVMLHATDDCQPACYVCKEEASIVKLSGEQARLLIS